MGDLPLENQRATRDGTCKRRSPGIRNGVVKSFEEVRGSRALRDNLIHGGGGGADGQVTPRDAFMGIVRHGWAVGNPIAINEGRLADFGGDRGAVGTEVGI